MQPRRPPSPAPGLGAPRRAAAKPLLLALLLGLALREAAPAPAGLPESQLHRGVLQRAALAAINYLNYRSGSPSALRALDSVGEGRVKVDPQKGCEVSLVFSTELLNPEEGREQLGKCSARVFFKNDKPRPAVNITCTRLLERQRRQWKDYMLYRQMKQLDGPPLGSIPDSYGNIDASQRPLWDLAVLGSSYVMWEKTTQFLHYYFIQLSSVKQWKTDGGVIDFDYIVLLHEFSTQEIIPCRIHLIWYPGKSPKVTYHCQDPQTPEEASGTEEGSAIAERELSNF